MRKKSLLFVIICLILAVLLAACGAPPQTEDPNGDEEAAPPDDENQLVFAIWSAPEGVFNLNLYESRYDADSFEPLFDGMLGSNPDLSYYYNLAEEYSISDDGLVFYYKLRDDIVFHDGEPVTTADVKFTFEWMSHPDYTGVRADNWQALVGFEEFQSGETDDLEGIKIINDQEIEFHFATVDAPAHFRVSTWGISPKHVFEGTPVGELENHPAITAPIGTGPFKFEQYVEGQYVEWVRNDDYHLGAPKLDRIIIKVANNDVALAELITESVDAAWMEPNLSDWANFEATGFLAIEEYPQNGYQYMGLQNDHPIFGDTKVRQAITYGIDRHSMVEDLLDGMGIVQVGHMSSVSWAYNEDMDAYPYDPEKAKELLAEAGWTPGSDGVLQKDGKKFEFTLSYPTGNPVRMDSALIIQQNLKEIGVEVELDIMDFNALIETVFDNQDFDAYLMGWGLAADPDATGIWGEDTAWNACNFRHPDNFRLLAEGRAIVEVEDRKPIYDEWQQLLYDEAPYVFLYASNEAYVYNDALKEFKPNPFAIWYDVKDWHWDR